MCAATPFASRFEIEVAMESRSAEIAERASWAEGSRVVCVPSKQARRDMPAQAKIMMNDETGIFLD